MTEVSVNVVENPSEDGPAPVQVAENADNLAVPGKE